MAAIDNWTDETAERALHLLRVAEAIVYEASRRPVHIRGIRPVTVDRWLTDASAFLHKHGRFEDVEVEATAVDGQGEVWAVDDRRSKCDGVVG